ncbi:MAG: hypothetical protein BGO12_17400 [Verrucomicrobia bacterium 61-8]|nr:hypothetical protein [Verrucomicrobiota bacterium]OJV03390.1 MAG: hypothetical protein BGO12_17400 [Verrucomicrobia bacterium 61-8]
MKPRLLVLELHHLGDAVLAIPFLREAAGRYEVAACVTPSAATMLRTFLPGLEIFEAAEGWKARWKQCRTQLRAWEPDVTVSAWSDTRVHIAARLTRARRRIGFPVTRANYYATHLGWRLRRLWAGQAMEFAARIVGDPLLTEHVFREPETRHLENWTHLARRLGFSLPLKTPWFPWHPTELPDAARRLITEARAEGKPVWALHAGGRLPTKRWPVKRYVAVLQEYFAARGLPVIIIRGPDTAIPMPQAPNQIVVDTTSHRELADLLSQVDYLLANDSYSGHLAAALGKPVVTIFGSGNPAWFAPFGDRNQVVWKDTCPYHPCIDRCQMPSYVCLAGVSESAVISALAEIGREATC